MFRFRGMDYEIACMPLGCHIPVYIVADVMARAGKLQRKLKGTWERKKQEMPQTLFWCPSSQYCM